MGKVKRTVFITLILFLFSGITANAATMTIPGTSMSYSGIDYDSGNNRYGASAYYYEYADDYVFVRPTVGFSGNCNLPSNTVITNATFRMYGGLWVNNHWEYEFYPATFFGIEFWTPKHFTGTRNTWWANGSSSYYSPCFYNFNVTNYFTNSSPSFSFSSTLNTTGYDSASFYYEPSQSYIQITYQYKPLQSTINAPTAGSYNKGSVSLSASSTVADGSPMTYDWYYSLDGSVNGTYIGTTSSTLMWDIPEEIPDDTEIYVYCYAKANGVYSVVSALTPFIKGYEPAVAAKMAAEKTLNYLVRPEVTVQSPAMATCTSGIHFPVMLTYTDDYGEDLDNMEYSYRINTGEWSIWQDLSGGGSDIVTIPISFSGINFIFVKVRNEAEVESKQASLNVWKL